MCSLPCPVMLRRCPMIVNFSFNSGEVRVWSLTYNGASSSGVASIFSSVLSLSSPPPSSGFGWLLDGIFQVALRDLKYYTFAFEQQAMVMSRASIIMTSNNKIPRRMFLSAMKSWLPVMPTCLPVLTPHYLTMIVPPIYIFTTNRRVGRSDSDLHKFKKTLHASQSLPQVV